MDIHLKYPLKHLLRSALAGTYSEGELRELHRLIYTLARHLVRRKLASGKLHLELIGLTPRSWQNFPDVCLSKPSAAALYR